ncbi:unnamed protein product [Urochloa humidicola]
MEQLVSPPPLPSPGAPTLTSPTPASTPEPAATHATILAKPFTQALATTSLSSVHTHACSPPPSGRSKEQRWCEDSPASASPNESAAATAAKWRSYRDVVATPAIPTVPSRLPLPVVAKPPPRILLRPPVHIPPPPRRTKDADGWEQVAPRYKRREQAEGSRRPRRPVPVDLWGRCFNCFSGEHRAAQCRSQTRCFRCRALGHRSFFCPRRSPTAPEGVSGPVVPPKRVTVWRRVAPAMAQVSTGPPQAMATPAQPTAYGVASDVPRVDESGAMPPDSERGGRRRRRPRHRRCRAPQGVADAVPIMVAGNGSDVSPAPPARDDGISPARGPPCVIDWSIKLARAEADLRLAVFVTVVGDIAGLDTEELKEVVATAFVLNPESLVFRRSSQDHIYIMFVEDEATIIRITNAGPIPGSGGLQLHCRRWSRQAFAEGSALPVLADVEFRGIPAHAWEMTTAESLLSPYGWPHLLQPDTRNRDDYSVFRVSAWCFNPSEMPKVRDLHIVEPSIDEIMVPPGKPTLMYPVSIQVNEIQHPVMLRANQVPTDTDENNPGNERRQRRRVSSPGDHGGRGDVAPTTMPAAGERLGPDASEAHHVACSVEADGSSSQATCIEPPAIEDVAASVPGPEVVAAAYCPEDEELAAGFDADFGAGLEAEELAPGIDAVVSGHEAVELAPGLDEIKVHQGAPDSMPGAGVVPACGGLGCHEEEEMGRPGVLDSSMGWAESLIRPVNNCEQEMQEHDADNLPSMESPTMASFAVPNHERQNRDTQDVVPGEIFIGDITIPPTQFSHSNGSPPPSCAQNATKVLLMTSPVMPAPSPVTWRPAKDVLPAEPLTEPVAMRAGREVNKVYFRWPRTNVQQDISQVPGSSSSTPPPHAASSTFIKNATKPLDSTLPIPPVKQQQRRRHDCVGTEPPRRSRRIANLPPENHNPSAISVCRELGFTDENSKVSAANLEKYQVFFNTPLKRNDVKIMAAMLCKELPEDFPVQANDAVIVA